MANTTAIRPVDWPNFAQTGNKTRPATDTLIATGFPQSTTPPTRQQFNWAFNEVFNGVRYLVQRGIAAYANTETYSAKAIVESGGLHYRCILDNGPANVQAPTNATYWERWGFTFAEITASGLYATTAQLTSGYVSNSGLTAALSGYITAAQLNGAVSAAVAAATPDRLPAGSLGVFGTGKWAFIPVNRVFISPATSIRVRTIGGGRGGNSAGSGAGGAGGAGGGYAHGVFTTTIGASFSCIIGAGSAGGTAPASGGTTSFGALISASGGQVSGGGTGTGGDFQAAGGLPVGTVVLSSGGGASGSQFGTGGIGGTRGSGSVNAGTGGGAVGNINSRPEDGSGGASPWIYDLLNPAGWGGADIMGKIAIAGADGSTGNENAQRLFRFPFDGFMGGGGAGGTAGGNGGPGCGGGATTTSGGAGGRGGIGAGGGSASYQTSGTGGAGGLGGGGGGGFVGGTGGNGFIVVEW